MSWLKGYLSTEKEKLSRLHGREKGEYIWQYYKLWIIGAVVLVWAAGFFCYRFLFTPNDNWFFAVFTNTYAEVGNGSELWNGFVEYSGYDTREKNVEFNNASYFDYTQNGGFGNTYYEAFVAYADSGTLDAVTMEKDQLVALGASGRLKDLNREECAALREKYGDRLVYTQPYDEDYSTQPVPVGIDVSDSILMTRYQIYSGDSCVLGIGAESSHLEAVETFLDYIFEEGQ